ncbi:MAG: hypothetical protein N2319_11665 [Candidatus Kapabacteria bacterium]|nr:hypothetical protein [Candidatus Kapabacteria bacterium]
MTIEKIQKQETHSGEKASTTVQNELQKDIFKQTVDAGSTQNQILQLLASTQPVLQIQQVAQNQIAKGFLDVKV